MLYVCWEDIKHDHRATNWEAYTTLTTLAKGWVHVDKIPQEYIKQKHFYCLCTMGNKVYLN